MGPRPAGARVSRAPARHRSARHDPSRCALPRGHTHGWTARGDAEAAQAAMVRQLRAQLSLLEDNYAQCTEVRKDSPAILRMPAAGRNSHFAGKGIDGWWEVVVTCCKLCCVG